MGWLISLLARKGYRSLTLMTTTGSGAVTGRQGVIHREVARLTGDACGRFVARLRSRAELTVSGAASRGEIEYVGEGGPLTVQVALLGGRDGEVVTLRRPELRHDIPFPIEAAPGLREVTSLPGLVVVALPTEATRRLVERLIVEQGAPGERLLLLGEGSPLLREKLPCIPLETLSSNDAATVIGEALEHGPDLLIIERCGDIRRLLAAARAALRGGRVVAGTGAGSAESLALIFTAWQRHHLIPAALRGIVVGEVIPTLCRSCREELSLSAEEAARLRLPLSPEGYRQSPGCTDCGFTGQGGSEFLVEVIPCDTPLIGLFERSGSSSDVAAALAARGEYRIPEKAARLLLSGEISPESYLRVVTG